MFVHSYNLSTILLFENILDCRTGSPENNMLVGPTSYCNNCLMWQGLPKWSCYAIYFYSCTMFYEDLLIFLSLKTLGKCGREGISVCVIDVLSHSRSAWPPVLL